MEVLGIGTDIVDVRRIRRMLERYPVRFPDRMLHPDEQSAYRAARNRSGFLAKRFAAKEATAKALGVGLRAAVSAKDIRIDHDVRGKPQVRLSNSCEAQFPGIRAFVSIADEADYALAYVLIVRASDAAE